MGQEAEAGLSDRLCSRQKQQPAVHLQHKDEEIHGNCGGDDKGAVAGSICHHNPHYHLHDGCYPHNVAPELEETFAQRKPAYRDAKVGDYW
jgi:hypothetical protein